MPLATFAPRRFFPHNDVNFRSRRRKTFRADQGPFLILQRCESICSASLQRPIDMEIFLAGNDALNRGNVFRHSSALRAQLPENLPEGYLLLLGHCLSAIRRMLRTGNRHIHISTFPQSLLRRLFFLYKNNEKELL